MEKQEQFTDYKLQRDILDDMDKLFRLDINRNERVKIRNKIMREVVEITNSNDLHKAPDDRANITSSLTKRRAVEDIIYRLTDRGYQYAGRTTVAKKLGCHVDTVDLGIRILKESGLFYWCYLKNGNGNSFKSIVFFYKNHELFESVKSFIISKDRFLIDVFSNEILNKRIATWIPNPDVETDVETEQENSETPCQNWSEEPKNVPTVLSPFCTKQVINNIYARDSFQISSDLSTDFRNMTSDVEINKDLHKIMKYLSYKVLDRLERGYDIKNIGSFCEVLVTRQFEYVTQKKRQEERELKESSTQFNKVSTPVPFYDWIESRLTKVMAKRRIVSHQALSHIKNLKNGFIDSYLVWEQKVVVAAELLGISCSNSLEETLEFINLECYDTYSCLEIELCKQLSTNNLLGVNIPA